MRKWQDWANLVLGLWLVLSPWILGFSGTSSATWNAVLLGLAVGPLSLLHLRGGPPWAESATGLGPVARPLPLDPGL